MWRLKAIYRIFRRFPRWLRDQWHDSWYRAQFLKQERLDHYLDDDG